MQKLTIWLLIVLSAWAILAAVVLAESPPGGDDLDQRLEKLREGMTTTNSGEAVFLVRDEIEIADFASNPYGCYGQTDKPYTSKTNGYTNIIVEARTVCSDGPAVPLLGSDVTLMRGSYCGFGYCAVWTSYGKLDINLAENTTEVEGLSSGIPCENGMYKGESLHYMVDSDGTFYYGYTETKEEVTRCQSNDAG